MAEQATQVEGAEPPPPGEIPDIDHPQDALYSISLAIAVLTLILPIPFLLMRIYTTWKLSTRLRVDDWSSAAAFLFGIAYLTSGIVFAEHGGGHHVWEVTDSQLQGILETTYWNSIVYSPAACLIKMTLLLITVRAFRSNRLFVYLGYSLMTVMVGYYVPETVLKIMTCRPIQGYWDYGEDSSCYDYRSVFLADAIGAVVTDMLVLLVAMPFAWMQGRVGVKLWLMVGAGSVATAMSLVRMVLVICLQETEDPTLDFVRLSLFGQLEIAIGLICTCLPTMEEYFQSRKGPATDSRNSRPRLDFRIRRILEVRRLRTQRLKTTERAAPAASHTASDIQVERDVVITGVNSPETPQRPPPYYSRPSTIESCATPSTSLESGAQNTTTVHEANDAAPPIPEKSSARLSIHRKSWGPATTLTSYMDYASQDPETGAAARCVQEPRSVSRLEGKEWLPCFPPPLFSETRGIPRIAEIKTPTPSTPPSTQHSPKVLRWSPRWNRWPRSPNRVPSPPLSPVEGLLQSLQPPPMWQSGYSDQDYRHYSL